LPNSNPAPANVPSTQQGYSIPSLNPGRSQGRPGYGLPTDNLSGIPSNDPLNYAAWGGRVVLDTGGAPPERAAIDMRCGPRLMRVAYTRPDGKFVYRELVAAADARSYSRANNGFSNLPLNFGATEADVLRADSKDCQLTAILPGYTSSFAFPFRERGYRQPSDVITLVLHRTMGTAHGVVSPTSKSAPSAARKAYEKALDAAENGKPEDAVKNLRKAADLYPQYAAAWCELGRVEAQQNRMQQAREAWSRAIGADPDYALPYLQLASLASAANDWPNLASLSAAVIRINPDDFLSAYMYNALAEYSLNHPETAAESLREELKRDADGRYPEAHFMLGNILGKRGDYTAAKEQFRAYLEAAPDGPHAPRTREVIAGLDAIAAAQTR
jgi:tetratricopeptide (TPR) repeat protein